MNIVLPIRIIRLVYYGKNDVYVCFTLKYNKNYGNVNSLFVMWKQEMFRKISV